MAGLPLASPSLLLAQSRAASARVHGTQMQPELIKGIVRAAELPESDRFGNPPEL